MNVQEWVKSEKGECPFAQAFMARHSRELSQVAGLDWAN